MRYQIRDGTVSLGGNVVLSHLNFEIRGKEKVAIVGANGAGKTTFLRLLAGELLLDRDDKRREPGIEASRRLTVGILRQQAFADSGRTVEEELLLNCPHKDISSREWLEYEREYDVLFTRFGFGKEDKKRKISEFSGGEQTRIALIRLLLEKPELLLLDEPTNHLDLERTKWLEGYLREYPHAVIVVSHDRFFLDQVADSVWELEDGKAVKYPGNYTAYRQEKKKRMALWQKAWERQQQELARLEGVVKRFKHKPAKASFAQAKKKQMERMKRVEAPKREKLPLFSGEIHPLVLGGKLVFEAEHLEIGYEQTILELSLRIRRGQKIGLLGENGAGKSTFLKTVAGILSGRKGEARLGRHITMGYFDQHSAEIQSDKSVLEHFHSQFPSLTDKEARSVLGAYRFGGREAGKRVNDLSGGEKARLVLAELLQSRPNFLILDEPTNHMDIPAKETLEAMFQAYTGTILFVSHDRYFIRQVAESILCFQEGKAYYYPFGYEHYLERIQKGRRGVSLTAQVLAEDQALIDSLRAVPRAERHRLREISSEEAYEEWRLAPVTEKMETAARAYEEMWLRSERLRREWEESEMFWTQEVRSETQESGFKVQESGTKTQEPRFEAQGPESEMQEPNPEVQPEIPQEQRVLGENQMEYEAVRNEAAEAWRQWHESCLEWFELWEELN